MFGLKETLECIYSCCEQIVASLENSRENSDKTEFVSTGDAVGRILCNDIKSSLCNPRFNQSAMDGYAVKSMDYRDCKQSVVSVPISARIYCGDSEQSSCSVNSLQAIKIATGAPVPEPFDTVVPQEECTLQNDCISINVSSVTPGRFINSSGEDFKVGQLIAQAGELITPQKMSLILASGHGRVEVYRQLKIGILTSGAELVEIDGGDSSEVNSGKIVSVTPQLISALLKQKQIDIEINNYGIFPDDPEKLETGIVKALDENHLLLTLGGASVGERDFIPSVLDKLSARIIFKRAMIKPGKPSYLAEVGSKFIFALPGKPAATYLTYQALVNPLINALAGYADFQHLFVTGRTSEIIKSDSRRDSLFSASVYYDSGQLIFRPVPLAARNTSHYGFIQPSDALIWISAGAESISPGGKIEGFILS